MVKIRFTACFLIWCSFSSKRLDHQKWMIKLCRSIIKSFSINFSTQNLLQGENQNYCIIFCFEVFLIKRNRWSKVEVKTNLEDFETISNRLCSRIGLSVKNQTNRSFFLFWTLYDQEEPMFKNGRENSAREWWNHFYLIYRPAIEL